MAPEYGLSHLLARIDHGHLLADNIRNLLLPSPEVGSEGKTLFVDSTNNDWEWDSVINSI